MTYKEILVLKKAFAIFLTKLKRQGDIRIKFYETVGREFNPEYAYIGYRTRSGGRFGIHYNPRKKTFSFGERNREESITPFSLNAGQEHEIPARLKELFLNVIEAKKSRNVSKSEWYGLP
jgi:hypothetical protein